MANVTVIIPHKNSFDSLAKLLACIPERVHVIVVDDKSDPEIQQKLYGLERKNWTLIFNQFDETNAGFARNLGIEALSNDCEWVMFADADDWMDRNNLEMLTKHLDLEEADVVLTGVDAKMLSGESSARADYIHKLFGGYPKNASEILFHWVGPIGKVIRKNLIDQNRLKYESRLASNDVVFSTKLAALKPSLNVFEPIIYTIIQSGSSLTATLSVEKAKARLEATWIRNRILTQNKCGVRLDYGLTYYKFIVFNGTVREVFEFFPGELRNFFLASRMNLSRLIHQGTEQKQ